MASKADPSARIVIAEISVVGLLFGLGVFIAFLAGVIHEGAKGGVSTRDIETFIAGLLGVGFLASRCSPYLLSMLLEGGVVLYIADDDLVLFRKSYRRVRLANIESIELGRRGLVRDPRSVTFSLRRGGWLSIHTIWLKTSVSDMLSRLKAAGLDVPVHAKKDARTPPEEKGVF